MAKSVAWLPVAWLPVAWLPVAWLPVANSPFVQIVIFTLHATGSKLCMQQAQSFACNRLKALHATGSKLCMQLAQSFACNWLKALHAIGSNLCMQQAPIFACNGGGGGPQGGVPARHIAYTEKTSQPRSSKGVTTQIAHSPEALKVSPLKLRIAHKSEVSPRTRKLELSID